MNVKECVCDDELGEARRCAVEQSGMCKSPSASAGAFSNGVAGAGLNQRPFVGFATSRGLRPIPRPQCGIPSWTSPIVNDFFEKKCVFPSKRFSAGSAPNAQTMGSARFVRKSIRRWTETTLGVAPDMRLTPAQRRRPVVYGRLQAEAVAPRRTMYWRWPCAVRWRSPKSRSSWWCARDTGEQRRFTRSLPATIPI